MDIDEIVTTAMVDEAKGLLAEDLARVEIAMRETWPRRSSQIECSIGRVRWTGAGLELWWGERLIAVEDVQDNDDQRHIARALPRLCEQLHVAAEEERQLFADAHTSACEAAEFCEDAQG